MRDKIVPDTTGQVFWPGFQDTLPSKATFVFERSTGLTRLERSRSREVGPVLAEQLAARVDEGLCMALQPAKWSTTGEVLEPGTFTDLLER
jgi:hypothetical protein